MPATSTGEHEVGSISFAAEVARGLAAKPKTLPCRFFYDAEGSRLFEQICVLPEYYPTRTETTILQARVEELASLCRPELTVVELGAGNAAKTRLLFDALYRNGTNARYVPVDISPTALESAEAALRTMYPALPVLPVVAEYAEGLASVPERAGEQRLFVWLGTSVGNLEPQESASLLASVRRRMAAGDFFLLGIDRRKDRETLERAYDDAQGVTARFNLNLLARINRELGGHFDLSAFRHRAFYNEPAGRVEMHLVSLASQRIGIDELGMSVDFEAGETIHTENSYKFSSAEIVALAAGAGMTVELDWRDEHDLFSLCLLGTVPDGGPASS